MVAKNAGPVLQWRKKICPCAGTAKFDPAPFTGTTGENMNIKNKALMIFAVAVFCFSAANVFSVQENGYEALLGTWDVQTESGEYTFMFVFTMDGDTLKGTYTGSSGEAEMQNLSYEDNTLKFTVEVSMVIDFTATIEDGSLNGMLAMQYGEANITGKKRKSSFFDIYPRGSISLRKDFHEEKWRKL